MKSEISRDSVIYKAKLVDDWNRAHDAGTIVDVTLDDGQVVRTVTATAADLLGEHTPVIWLRSVASVHTFRGAYDLTRVTAAPCKEPPDFVRAGFDSMCAACRQPYYRHPPALDYPSNTGHPWLIKLCDGSLVKC